MNPQPLDDMYQSILMEPSHDEFNNDSIPRLLLNDLHHRLGHIERSIPPRVQTLESAVTDIKMDFKEMREESREMSRQNREALQQVSEQLRENTQYHMQAIDDMRNTHTTEIKAMTESNTKLGTKISFYTGALWVLGLIGGAFFAYGDKIGYMLTILFGAG